MPLTQPATTCSIFVHGRLPRQHDRTGEALRNAGSLPGLSGGSPVAIRVCLLLLRLGQSMEDGERPDPMRGMPPTTIRPCGYSVSRHAHAASDVVSGDVARMRKQERDECAEPTAAAWSAELQHGLVLPTQTASDYGAAWA